MTRFFAVFLLILAIPTFATADIYIKSKAHTDSISIDEQNQPAKDTVSEQWIGDGKAATVTTANTTIMDLNKSVVYIVNHKAKSYIEATLPLDFASLLPPEMADLVQSMKMTATVAPTNKKRTFGTRSCDEYEVSLNMSIISMKLKVYATTDVPFDLKNYTEKVQAGMLKSQFMGLDDSSLKELDKIQGLWIATETTAETMGIKVHSNTEVIEITEKPAPDGLYSIPSGYTKQDKISVQDLLRR